MKVFVDAKVNLHQVALEPATATPGGRSAAGVRDQDATMAAWHNVR